LQDGTVVGVDYLRKTGCLEREQIWSRALEGATSESLKVPETSGAAELDSR
jgi:hypothetical protein